MTDNNPDMRSVKAFGNDYFKNNYFRKKEKVVTYGGDQLQFGRRRDGSIYYLDLSEACRMIALGATRSGKTFMMRQFADRIHRTKRAVVFIPDPKDEFKSSVKPVQAEFQHLLMEGEKPQGMKVVALRPTFFKQIDKDPKGGFSLKKDNFWYSPDITNMTQSDFTTLMSSGNFTPSQRAMLEMVFPRLKEVLRDIARVKKRGNKVDFDLYKALCSITDELPDFQDQQKTALKTRFSPLATSFFYEAEYERSLTGLVRAGFVPAINMEKFNYIGRGGAFLYPDVVVSMTMREIINARREDLIPEVWIIADEISRFVTNEINTCVRTELEESFELDTRYEINYFLAVQSISTVPERLLDNTRYIMVPARAKPKMFVECLKRAGLIKTAQSQQNVAMRYKNAMSESHKEWLIVDIAKGTADIVRCLGPLSHHTLQGQNT